MEGSLLSLHLISCSWGGQAWTWWWPRSAWLSLPSPAALPLANSIASAGTQKSTVPRGSGKERKGVGPRENREWTLFALEKGTSWKWKVHSGVPPQLLSPSREPSSSPPRDTSYFLTLQTFGVEFLSRAFCVCKLSTKNGKSGWKDFPWFSSSQLWRTRFFKCLSDWHFQSTFQESKHVVFWEAQKRFWWGFRSFFE